MITISSLNDALAIYERLPAIDLRWHKFYLSIINYYFGNLLLYGVPGTTPKASYAAI
jgi:hypothetical protein